MNTPHGRAEIIALCGNPSQPNGMLDPAWEAANIVLVKPPGWALWYQGDSGPVPSRGIRMHRVVRESFLDVMADVWRHATNEAPLNPVKWLHERRLDLHGGGFTYRAITGGKALSLHAYGIAIDWDPAHNPRGHAANGIGPLPYTYPEWAYEIWASHGWSDGRHFLVPDPMHVQAAVGA